MKNKVLAIIIVLISIITFCGCDKSVTDSQKFKQEYESLNGSVKNDKTIRSIKIKKNNPFIYSTEKEIVNLIDKKETFVVYFGFAECPWCRSVLETLIKVSEDLDIDKIYYVDIQNTRDVLEVKEDGSIEKTKDASEDYYLLLEKLDNVLSDYNLIDSNGNKVDTNEKRIYAPNVISVVDGKAQKLETGISSKQSDPYMKLTDEMKNETYNLFECALKCITENKKSCSKGC